MRLVLLMVIILSSVIVLGAYFDELEIISQKKAILFGGQYNTLYDYWLGVRGKGKGLGLGEIGLVGGFSKDLVVGEKYKLELYADIFVYADLLKLSIYGFEEYNEYLYWECNVWLGIR